MGNPIELRNRVKDILNANVVDPYPSGFARRGNHFYDETDSINLNRKDTFPKGFLKISSNPESELSGIGKTGRSKEWTTIDIFYYTKEKSNFTVGSDTYKNSDIMNYILNNIKEILLTNRIEDYHLTASSFGDSGEPSLINSPNGTFKLYFGILPVTYIWSKTY